MVKNNEYVNKRNVKLIKVLNKTRVLVECPLCGSVLEMWKGHFYRGSNSCKCICLENPIYRPFKSCDELVYYWEREKVGYSPNPLQMIDIWVKHKVDGRRRMIVGFGDNFVEVGDKAKPITLERLFEMYTFLDGEPCGVMEK